MNYIVVDFLALGFNVGDKGLLLLDNLIKVLKELGKLDHLALDVLDSLVALLDVAQRGRGLAATVRVHEL